MLKAIHDPRIRVVLIVVLALLGLAFAWHLAGEHVASPGACVGILAALMLLLRPKPQARGVVLEPETAATRIPEPLVPSPGRHPPGEGTALRL